MLNVAEIRNRLEARLRLIEERLYDIEQLLREPEENDSEERASEWDDDDVLNSLARVSREEIGLIREALERITDGSYGACSACGRRIGQRRLRALPQAATCIKCAQIAA
jgi:RNA polymerase-binding transcription factor DksA